MTSPAAPRLWILADHPSLHRGFSTIAREVAAYLHRNTPWSVGVVGYYPPAPGWRSPGYEVVDLDRSDEPRSTRVPRLTRALRGLDVADAPTPTLLLCMGTLFDLDAALEAVRGADLRRSAVLVGYTPVDFAPFPAGAIEVLSRFDRVFPFTGWARDALIDGARRAQVRSLELGSPIPLGVDTARFRPLPDDERDAARRELFGLGPDDRLVGYFGRNSENKRVDIVLRLFASVVSGRWTRCERCSNTSPFGLDRDGRPAAPLDVCPVCGGAELAAGRPRDSVSLYLHTDVEPGAASGGRDLLSLAGLLGVREQVLFRNDLQIGRGDETERLARRMACCDVHILPYHAAGWELTVLETGACGVPNVITDAFAPPEYAHPFSRRVPVGSWVLSREPAGLMDADLGLAALLELLDDEVGRRRLGARGPVAARAFEWRQVGELWVRALGPLVSPPDA